MQDFTHNANLSDRARKLRCASTRQEKHLWYDFLHSFEPHFYRQVAIKCYILDFYCPAAKLAIELDGSQHYTEQGMEYDAERTKLLQETYGIEVLRFTNPQVRKSFHGVCCIIGETVKKRMTEFGKEVVLKPI